jgi:simple sugar transport system permease protein
VSALRPLLAAAAALALAALAIAALGLPAGPALASLARGSLGGPAAWTATLLKTGPLLLTGLSVALAVRCGVWNIGAEGQLLAGALAATALATRVAPGAPPALLLPLVALGGAAAAAALGALAGWLRASRGVSEVISTILLNYILIQAVAWAVQDPLQEARGLSAERRSSRRALLRIGGPRRPRAGCCRLAAH